MRDRRSSLAWGPLLLGSLLCCVAVTDSGKKWSLAQPIDQQDLKSAWPKVAADASGTAIAVWEDFSLDYENVWATRYTAATGWGPIQRMNNDAATSRKVAYDAQVAMDGHGNAVVVWKQGFLAGDRHTTWSNRYTAANGWGAAVRLDTEDQGDALDPQVAVDPDGNAIAVWHQSDGIRENIWAIRSTPADGWGTAELIELNSGGNAGDPQIAIDPDGNAIGVWHQSDGTSFDIWANRYTPSGGWDTAARIETNDAGPAYLPKVAMDSNGNAVAVWHQSDGTRFDVWANRSAPSGVWGAAERIDAGDAGDAANPNVGMDADGNAIAVWNRWDGARENIWAIRYTPADGWDAAARIETNDAEDALRPRVAVSANGSAIVVWRQVDDTGGSNVWANSYTPSTGWGTAVHVDPEHADEGRGGPDVAIDPSGNGVAVWRRVLGSRLDPVAAKDQILSARFE